MNYRFAVICWAVVSASLFALIGYVISNTGHLWPLWFVIFPFLISIDHKYTDGESG
jgi:hypothetical protein